MLRRIFGKHFGLNVASGDCMCLGSNGYYKLIIISFMENRKGIKGKEKSGQQERSSRRE
jgi:hypothetical protein